MAAVSSTDWTAWRDGKRYMWLAGLVPPTMLFLVAPIAWTLVHLGYRGVAEACAWVGPVLIFVLLPALDRHFDVDRSNPPDELLMQLENDKYYRYCTYIYIPFQYISVIVGAYLFTATDLSWVGAPGGISWPSKVGLALSIGVLGGLGINVAHELGHKRDGLERWLARVTLAQTGYGHFYVEHNRGHHVRIATPEDPASSRFGESYWRFLPRSVFGGLRSAWQLEATRLDRCGQRRWSRHNDVLTAWAMSLAFWALLIAMFRAPVLPFIAIQAVYGISLLESANYLEHYGLLRRRLPSGRYERPSPEHSWNSDHLVTNLFLFHLQRHSDHHANPTRRYQTLRSMPGSPQLPAGYATLIGLAYFPPLWRRVMDHRVLAHYGGDLSRINVAPRRGVPAPVRPRQSLQRRAA